jgi:hypothetical protein
MTLLPSKKTLQLSLPLTKLLRLKLILNLNLKKDLARIGITKKTVVESLGSPDNNPVKRESELAITLTRI